MTVPEVPPFALFFAAALLVPLLPTRLRQALLLLTPVVAGLYLLLGSAAGLHAQVPVVGYTLTLFRVDRLSLLFGYLFCIAAFLSILFSLHLRDTAQHVAGLLYAGSALGAVFAGDLIVLLFFSELLGVTSVFLIWARRTPRAVDAGFRYLLVQLFAGVVLLSGIVLHVRETGSIAFGYLGLDGLASGLIFTAFGIKCAFPLVHNWLTDAYPEATATGTVFLSAFTTKVAVYVLARGFPGTEILIYIGAIMTCFPIFYAVIENDLRRVLAYSMINQLGFMVCGIGIGTALAVNGAVAHAFNDVIFKALLMMAMGAVLHRSGRIAGSELGGLYKSMPLTAGLCIVGAASISAFPLFSGFVSKSMVMSAAVNQGHYVVWLALLFASAGVFHHAGIKIPFFAFFSHDAGIRVPEAPLNMLLAMGLAAALCIFIGSYPWTLYSLLPFPVVYSPFDATHVIAQLQLLFFSALAFTWLKLSGIYPPELPSINIDAEWVYRRLAPRALGAIGAAVVTADRAVRTAALSTLKRVLTSIIRPHAPGGVLARTWQSGSMVLLITLLLGGLLILNFI